MLDCQFFDIASECPDIIMHQLKSIYNSPFKDSYSHPINTCFAMIASNGLLFHTSQSSVDPQLWCFVFLSYILWKTSNANPLGHMLHTLFPVNNLFGKFSNVAAVKEIFNNMSS